MITHYTMLSFLEECTFQKDVGKRAILIPQRLKCYKQVLKLGGGPFSIALAISSSSELNDHGL